MRFFEFKQEYEYYALIAVPSVDGNFDSLSTAIETYAENIEGSMEHYNEYYLGCLPSELTIDEALARYRNSDFDDIYTEEDKEKDFYKQLDHIAKWGNPAILLIDSDLF